MSFHPQLSRTFVERVTEAKRPQIGLWICSGSPVAAEIFAGSGLDWVLIDGEHSPAGLETTVELLRATAGYPATPVVRVPAVDRVLIKQYLDLGAQNLMVPMVDNVALAREVVAAVNYPPEGVRGVGSGLARAARWGGVPDYLANARDTISLIIQIESAEGVASAADIAALAGVDAAFIGPADLAASLGLLGQQAHPEVVAGVKQSIRAFRDAGKPVGVNAFNLEQAQDYLDAGAEFVAVGADVQQLGVAARSFVEKFITPREGH